MRCYLFNVTTNIKRLMKPFDYCELFFNTEHTEITEEALRLLRTHLTTNDTNDTNTTELMKLYGYCELFYHEFNKSFLGVPGEFRQIKGEIRVDAPRHPYISAFQKSPLAAGGKSHKTKKFGRHIDGHYPSLSSFSFSVFYSRGCEPRSLSRSAAALKKGNGQKLYRLLNFCWDSKKRVELFRWGGFLPTRLARAY